MSQTKITEIHSCITPSGDSVNASSNPMDSQYQSILFFFLKRNQTRGQQGSGTVKGTIFEPECIDPKL